MSFLILFIDTVSRAHFFRSFPKTANYMEKFYGPKALKNKKIKTIGF